MKSVHPEVFLVSRPQLDYEALAAYLAEVGGESWLERLDRGQFDDAQNLAEFAGKICYRAWEPGLNPNIVRWLVIVIGFALAGHFFYRQWIYGSS